MHRTTEASMLNAIQTLSKWEHEIGRTLARLSLTNSTGMGKNLHSTSINFANNVEQEMGCQAMNLPYNLSPVTLKRNLLMQIKRLPFNTQQCQNQRAHERHQLTLALPGWV